MRADSSKRAGTRSGRRHLNLPICWGYRLRWTSGGNRVPAVAPHSTQGGKALGRLAVG